MMVQAEYSRFVVTYTDKPGIAGIIERMNAISNNGHNPCNEVLRRRLRVYITEDCFSCQEAVLIAAEVTQRFPQIVTEIVNLHDPCTVQPDNVFAVPTYVLDGEVISLGNPYREHLFVKIADALSGKIALKP